MTGIQHSFTQGRTQESRTASNKNNFSVFGTAQGR